MIFSKFSLFNINLFQVNFKIDGDENETGVRSLNGEIKSVLQRSSIDSFIMAVKM
jgi:hypothetical protein